MAALLYAWRGCLFDMEGLCDAVACRRAEKFRPAVPEWLTASGYWLQSAARAFGVSDLGCGGKHPGAFDELLPLSPSELKAVGDGNPDAAKYLLGTHIFPLFRKTSDQ